MGKRFEQKRIRRWKEREAREERAKIDIHQMYAAYSRYGKWANAVIQSVFRTMGRR